MENFLISKNIFTDQTKSEPQEMMETQIFAQFPVASSSHASTSKSPTRVQPADSTSRSPYVDFALTSPMIDQNQQSSSSWLDCAAPAAQIVDYSTIPPVMAQPINLFQPYHSWDEILAAMNKHGKNFFHIIPEERAGNQGIDIKRHRGRVLPSYRPKTGKTKESSLC